MISSPKLNFLALLTQPPTSAFNILHPPTLAGLAVSAVVDHHDALVYVSDHESDTSEEHMFGNVPLFGLATHTNVQRQTAVGCSLHGGRENMSKMWCHAAWPLILHFILTVVIATGMITWLDNREVSITTRRPSVTQVDGLVTTLRYTLLQTDVTTALSSAQTVLRFLAGLWTASTVWRCIFILLHQKGVSLKNISWMLTWGLPGRDSGSIISPIALILLAAFPVQFSSPILTGSITWKPSDFAVRGDKLLTGISVSTDGQAWNRYRQFPTQIGGTVIQRATGVADMAWGGGGNDDDGKSIKRVLPTSYNLPVNATLDNVTVPYFVVDAFQWLPITTVDNDLWLSIKSPSEKYEHDVFFSPFMNAEGPYMGFISAHHDSAWGPTPSTFPTAVSVSETRTLVTLVDHLIDATPTTPCPNSTKYYGDLPPEVQLLPKFFPNPNVTNCFAFLNVTYRAGVVSCDHCKLSAKAVLRLRDDSDVSKVQPDVMTQDALALVPKVAQAMIIANVSIPSPINNINTFIPAVLSRAYQTGWTAYTEKFQSPSTSLTTSVMIPVPLSKANVLHWRVYLWVAINFSLTLSGLLFFRVQMSVPEAMVIDGHISALLLNSEPVLKAHPELGLDSLSLLTTQHSKTIGRLHLREVDGHRVLVPATDNM